MSLDQLITITLEYIASWAGITLPKILAGAAGAVLCIFSITALCRKKIKTITGVWLFFFGGFLVVLAVDPGILYILAKLHPYTRIRVLMVALSVLVMMITIEAIRRSHMEERFAVLWVITSINILIIAFFPPILDFLRAIVGTQYPVAVIGILFTFLLLIAFCFSIFLSTLRKNQAKISQKCALLEEKINELSAKISESSRQNAGRGPTGSQDSAPKDRARPPAEPADRNQD